MKLPNYESAVLKPDKLTAYLLSDTHPYGRHKARFFGSFGFALSNWQQLADALLKHAGLHDVTNVEPSAFGVRYVVDGRITSPDLRNPTIRSVWFIETGTVLPFFVTAYPLEGK